MNDYGGKFTQPPLYIAKGYKPDDISSGPRIGIDNTEEARFYPWRYWVSGNRFVSR